MSRISVIVPVYNGETTVRVLCSRLTAAIETITADFEIQPEAIPRL